MIEIAGIWNISINFDQTNQKLSIMDESQIAQMSAGMKEVASMIVPVFNKETSGIDPKYAIDFNSMDEQIHVIDPVTENIIQTLPIHIDESDPAWPKERKKTILGRIIREPNSVMLRYESLVFGVWDIDSISMEVKHVI